MKFISSVMAATAQVLSCDWWLAAQGQHLDTSTTVEVSWVLLIWGHFQAAAQSFLQSI
jgi:hypothetical protein